jgi:hypothetical protein
MDNALVHSVGDVKSLSDHITLLHENRELLAQLRAACLRSAPDVTWTAAGRYLLNTFLEILNAQLQS